MHRRPTAEEKPPPKLFMSVGTAAAAASMTVSLTLPAQRTRLNNIIIVLYERVPTYYDCLQMICESALKKYDMYEFNVTIREAWLR